MRWWRGGGFGSGGDGGEEVVNVVVRGWCGVVAVVRWWCDDVGGVVNDVVREVVASDVWQRRGDEGGVPAVGWPEVAGTWPGMGERKKRL
ncbi:hypothetical protein Tco_0847513, partial [Tanacetum coccineum]